MKNMHDTLSRRSGFLVASLWLAVGAYVLAGLAAMWLLSPRVPYADQWGFYSHLIERPFPANMFAAENGHREVLPNVVRLVELHGMAANQNLQILVGLLCALGSFVVLAITIRRAPVAMPLRAAATLGAAIGIFWLGNERALAHSNDAVHAYPVILFLTLALVLAARASPDREVPRIALAVACAIGATFSFGSGIAVLPVILLVLLLRRAPAAAWITAGVGLALALGLYLLGQIAETTTTLEIAPLRQAGLLLHWLATPIVHVFWPLLDPQIAAQLPPGILRGTAEAFAGAWSNLFGPITESRWPQMIVSSVGVAAFLLACWRAWQSPAPAAAALRITLGVAAFGLVVGGVIAMSRSVYFETHAGQIQATRYMVWSSLFWAGLFMASMLRARRPRLAPALALCAALVVAPSQIWMGQLALRMKTAAEQVALGGVIGVLDRNERIGETVPAEMMHALPLLADRRAAMHAWPETVLLGSRPDERTLQILVDATIEAMPVDNTLGGEGMVIVARIEDEATRLVLLDAEGVVIGMVQRYPYAGGPAYRGWLRGKDATGLRVAALL